MCWKIRAVEYYPDGMIKRVEYVQPEPIEFKESDWLMRKELGLC